MKKTNLRKEAKREYNRWLEHTKKNPMAQHELLSIKNDREAIVDAFYEELEFGTSGLRGVMGYGTNRINEYVIARATKGVGAYLSSLNKEASVVIACDTRENSKEFAYLTAKILSAMGHKVYLFANYTPVPVMVYALKNLQASLGIMITASHNPRIFNGYKVYNRHGYQIVGEELKSIQEAIKCVDYFDKTKLDSANIQKVSKVMKRYYMEKIKSMSSLRNLSDLGLVHHQRGLKVVYTPLNGTGRWYLPEILDQCGFKSVHLVESQLEPDGKFRTCESPNPEKISAYNEAFKKLEAVKGDIIIATDPDADRVGVALIDRGVKTLLTGNQVAILLLDYLCHVRPPKKGQFLVKSIVSTPFVKEIFCKTYGGDVVNTMTGFKYIGEIITRLEEVNQKERFYFGFEESNGYLASPYICDKDGISSALLICEMAAFHKVMGKSLSDRLRELYREYGHLEDRTKNYAFEGLEGMVKMKNIMKDFRYMTGPYLGRRKIVRKIDYLYQDRLPKSDVIEFNLEDGTKIIIRPSGTEPKLKVYGFFTGSKAEIWEDLEKVIYQ